MKTFIKIVQTRKRHLVKDLTERERTCILRSLVRVALNYKLCNNLQMYKHVMS